MSRRFDPDRHHRGSHRLRDHDYTQSGEYFVTICTSDMTCIFGDIIDSQMRPNYLGQIVQAHWLALPSHFPNLKLDTWQLMPNHLHGILILASTSDSAAPPPASPDNQFRGTTSGSLGAIIQSFKKITTRKIRQITRDPEFRIWQRDYYDHVVRDHYDLVRIRAYISENPTRWHSKHTDRSHK